MRPVQAQGGAGGASRDVAAPASGGAGASAPLAPPRSDAGAPSTQAGAAAPAPGNAVCSALATCCAELTDEDEKEDCEEVAQDDDAERCTRASEAACQTQAMPTMPSEACSKLSTCCATLPGERDQEECQEDVTRADDERCTRQLQRTCPELGPPPREPACVTLQACCPTLTEPRALELCRRALQEDEEDDCTEAQMELCQ